MGDFSVLSDGKLRAMYHSRQWQSLKAEEKLDLLQETVNRQTTLKHMEPCKVVLKEMPGNQRGYQQENTVVLNKEMVLNGSLSYQYGENRVSYPVDNANYLSAETITHEFTHYYQTQVSEGKIDAPVAEKNLYKANDFTVSYINGERACQYMKGTESYDLYLLNPTELLAHKAGQEYATALAKEHKAHFGTDTAIASYEQQIKESGIQTKLAQLKSTYGETVVKDVATVLHNSYYGTDFSVDKRVESIVHKEMISTQKYIDMHTAQAEKNTPNRWIDKHIDKQAYDQTLRESVNRFYEHESQNPTLSREETVAQTALMAENYLTEMNAFDMAQASQSAQSAGDAVVQVEVGESGAATGAQADTAAGAQTDCGGVEI